MVPLADLWLPIVVSAAVVFVASSVMHMCLKYHAGDVRPLPAQDDVQSALRPFNIPPGDYMLPCAKDMKEYGSPEFTERFRKGPVALITVLPSGPQSMSGSLVLWFAFTVLISIFAAYVAGSALGPGARYLAAFRFAGVTAFSGYALALLQNSIWYKRRWGTTAKYIFDGLVYALLTGGVFGWLWPA